MVGDFKPRSLRTNHDMAHGLAARIAIYCAQCQTEGVLIRLLGNILHSRTAHLAKGSRDFGGRLILAKLLFTLNPSKVTDLDICPCSESSTRSFSTHRTVAVARELERVSNFVFDCATEATASNHFLPSNVELTGAARLYRAASSDRRERG